MNARRDFGGFGDFFPWIDELMCFCCHFRSRLLAWLFSKSDRLQHKIYGQHKQKLFAELPNEIIEIGPGSGVNFRYYRPGTIVHAIEPNPFFQTRLRENSRQYKIDLRLHECSAEEIPLPDGKVAAVVCTLVLCSVPQVAGILKEIVRCLRPNGSFLFVEHVVASKSRIKRLTQHALTPVWRILFDGCRLNRNTLESIRQAGVDVAECSEVSLGLNSMLRQILPFSPHIVGRAIIDTKS